MFMTIREVAEQLQLSLGAVYKAVNNGTLKHHRFGSAIRVSKEQFDEYLAQTQSDESRQHLPIRHFKHL